LSQNLGCNFEKLFYRTYGALVDSRRGQQMKKPVALSVILLGIFLFSLMVTPLSNGQTSSIKATNYTWYTDSAGFLDVVGEIENVGTTTYTSVDLTATMTTTTGTTQTAQAMAFINDMLPNQKAPFYMSFYLQADQTTGIVPSVADVKVSVTQAPTTTNYLYQDVKVISQQNSIDTTADNKGSFWVTGTVQNTGSQTATGVRVLGTFYDSNGKVVAYGGYDGTDPLSASLAPSAKADFKFGAYDYNQSVVPSAQRIVSYVILVQVAGPELSGTAPQITPAPTIAGTVPPSTTEPSGTTTANPSATQPGQTANNNQGGNTTPNWLIPAVIIIVIAAAIAVAALALKKRSPPKSAKPTKTQK
jgi:hypothetical protein